MQPYKRWRGVKNRSLPLVAYLTREVAKVSVPDGGLSLSRVVLFEALDKYPRIPSAPPASRECGLVSRWICNLIRNSVGGLVLGIGPH